MNIYYSTSLDVLVDQSGNPLQALPQLAFGDQLNIVFTALDANSDVLDISSAVTWTLTVDADRSISTLPLCKVLPSGISFDSTSGSLSFLLNSQTNAFQKAVNGKSQLTLFAELCGYDSANTRIFRFPWHMSGCMPVDGNLGASGLSLPTSITFSNFGTVYADFEGNIDTLVYDFNGTFVLDATAYALNGTIKFVGSAQCSHQLEASVEEVSSGHWELLCSSEDEPNASEGEIRLTWASAATVFDLATATWNGRWDEGEAGTVTLE